MHGVVADPLFAGGEVNDWSKLMDASPALKLGFQLIDISQVGPRAAVVADVSVTRMLKLKLDATSFNMNIHPSPLLTQTERAVYEANWKHRRDYHGPDSHVKN